MYCTHESLLAENCFAPKMPAAEMNFAFETTGVLTHAKGEKVKRRRSGAFSAYHIQLLPA